MADFNPAADLEGASDYSNMLARQDDEVRKTNAYNALAKVYGPIAGNPQLATDTASAQTAMANAPNVQAANTAKAQALVQAQKDFGAPAGNPEAQTQNLANQDTNAQNLRQAQFRGIQMLKTVPPKADGSVDGDQFDRIVGANAKTLGLTDPDQLASFKAAVTAPGGSAHLDQIGQALLAPTKVSGGTTVVKNADGTTSLARTDQYGNPIETPLAPGQTTAQLINADTGQKKLPILQQNANTNSAKVPIMQQNANTAAYSANTRSNNSNFGNPNGQAGASPTRANPGGNASAATTHVGNEDGTATTPTFERLAPVGSKARATAIGGAQAIVNQDTTLQNANQVLGQAMQQVPAGAGPSSLIKDLPGTVQANLNANLATIKSNEQMAWISSLKNASGQTGIGRVLQSEAKNAEALFGNLGQEQTVGQLQLHLKLAQQAINQLHNTAQGAFKAQWGQDPYALLGQTQGKGGSGGTTPPADKATAAAYAKYGIN